MSNPELPVEDEFKRFSGGNPDEFSRFKGDRPPDARIGDFDVWDPTGQLKSDGTYYDVQNGYGNKHLDDIDRFCKEIDGDDSL